MRHRESRLLCKQIRSKDDVAHLIGAGLLIDRRAVLGMSEGDDEVGNCLWHRLAAPIPGRIGADLVVIHLRVGARFGARHATDQDFGADDGIASFVLDDASHSFALRQLGRDLSRKATTGLARRVEK